VVPEKEIRIKEFRSIIKEGISLDFRALMLKYEHSEMSF
jgi:hypothetical protein